MPEQGQVHSNDYAAGATPALGLRLGRQGEQVVSQLHGSHYEEANQGRIFCAHAIVTAPVIYTTAAGTGGPLLWNGSTTHKLVLLAAGWGISTVSTVAAIIGLTGGSGQSSAPSSTTAVDSVKCTYMGGPAPAGTAYRVGTVAAAGTFFHPLGCLYTGALTTTPGSLMNWVDLNGMFVIPPTGWISWAASATASTTVANLGLVWAEVPISP